jgi:gamma-glutamylaminecyclotransferase
LEDPATYGEIMNVTRLFVYGTLRQGNGNNYLIKGSRKEEDGVIHGFDMYTHGGFPMIKDGVGSIKVESYIVDTPTLYRVDSLEGHPSFYRRRLVEDNNGRKGSIYVYQYDTDTLNHIPSGDWEEYRKRGAYYV